MLILVAALALAAGAPAADAATAAPAQASDGLKPGEKKVKVICKVVTKANSRFTQKHCYELEAYKRQQEIDRQAFEETQNRPMINPGRGN